MTDISVADEFAGISGIYALIDPTDGTVGYVGKSKDIAQRYAQHVDGFGSDRKSAWIADLADQDLKPELKLLERCTADLLDSREDYWLTFYLDSGEAIYNESKKVKCSTAISKKGRKTSVTFDAPTAVAIDALVFLTGSATAGSATGLSQVIEQVVWRHIADNLKDSFDLFKVMLRKRGVDFNAELSKRT